MIEENSNEPSYYQLLDLSDQIKYKELKESFSTPEHKYNRGKRVETFQQSLEEIRRFCNRGDGNDWKRFLVCGMCWNQDFLAINTRQLRILLDKCKSSINGALSKMGFCTLPIKGECCTELIVAIPFLRGNYVEQRQWSVRTKVLLTPKPIPKYVEQFPIYEPYLSPQPNQNKKNKITVKGSILELFGAIDGKVIDGKECAPKSEFSHNSLNMFTDPVCCCPVEWICDISSPEEMTTFG